MAYIKGATGDEDIKPANLHSMEPSLISRTNCEGWRVVANTRQGGGVLHACHAAALRFLSRPGKWIRVYPIPAREIGISHKNDFQERLPLEIVEQIRYNSQGVSPEGASGPTLYFVPFFGCRRCLKLYLVLLLLFCS